MSAQDGRRAARHRRIPRDQQTRQPSPYHRPPPGALAELMVVFVESALGEYKRRLTELR